MQRPFEEWRLAVYSVNNFSSKKTSIDCSRERTYNAIELSLPVYVKPFCVMPLCDMSLSVRHNQLVAVQLWIHALMIWTIFFQILILDFFI